MILDESVDNIAMALFHVNRLRELRSSAAFATLNAVLQPLFGNGYNSQFEAGTVSRPRMFMAGNAERVVMWIDGASTASQASSLVDGYGGGVAFDSFQGRNGYIHELADWFLNRFDTSAMVKPEHLDFVGYSLGGAVAIAMKDKLVQTQSTYKSKVVTFGAPRTGTTPMSQRLSSSPIARYMFDADPIPLLPPRSTDIPLILPSLNPLTIIRYSTFVHTQGGIVLFPNGTVVPGILPPVAAMTPAGSLAGWYLGVENDPDNPHSLDRYYGALQVALTLLPSPSQQNVEDGPREQEHDVDRKDMTREQKRVVGVINAQGRAQNAVPQVTPEANLFAVLRLGRIWYVTFGGEIVMTAPIEKRARHIARAGNDFLRSMQKQAFVDPVTLISQFTTFMELAADPTSGFSPPIKIGLDV